MVYVTSDGRVVQERPWGLRRLVELFWAVIGFILYFFQSLFGLDTSNSYGSKKGRGGSSGGPGGGPGGGPRRNVRTFRDMKEIQDCSMPGGG